MNILEEVQTYVADKLNADPQLSACPFLVENRKDIDYEIKNALGRQGIVGLVMTPKATYAGAYMDAGIAWQLDALEIDVVENVTVNRGKKTGYITGQDAAMRLFDVLCPLNGEHEGQFSPVSYDEGEDNSLLVNKSIFKCLVHKLPSLGMRTKVTYADGSSLMVEVEGVLSSSSIPSISDVVEVEIGNAVTSIAASAFQGCSNLNSVAIPNSVTAIGAIAFENCTGLSSVDIPSSVTSLEERAFRGCTSLTNVTIPDSVTSIGSSVFYYCKELTSVTIGNSVESIGDSAFYYCTSLQSVTIPDSVETVGNQALGACTSLSSVTIGNNVESIGSSAFDNCKSLVSVTIPDSVASIGEYAFERCSGLSSIEFGDSLSSIGATAFTKCYSLVEATLPESIQSIGANAFSGCTSMAQLLFEGKTDRQVKAMANYSWGLPEGVARGAVIETFSVNWYVTDGTTSSVPGGYVAGDTIRFDTDDASKSLQFVSVNGVEISDTSVYGQSFYEYVVQEEDVFLQVTFAVPQAKATFSFTGTNVSCDLPDGEYCVGKVVNFQTLPVEDALSSMQTSMLSAVYVNGVLDLDVARSFGRPSLSATTWQYVLKEGENTVDAYADLLPYCKDRTHYWVGYNSSNGALSWRSCDRSEFALNQTNPQIYITGPERMPNYTGSGFPPKTFDWTTPYGDTVDWTDIEDVFVPCTVYNVWPGQSTPPGIYLQPAAFANMPSLRKVKFDCMRPSDPGWNRFGNRGNGAYWTADSVYVSQGAITNTFGGASYMFYNSPNLEEVDFSYDEGGIFRISSTLATRFVNWFYNTKLKELKMRIYCSISPQSTGTFSNLYFTEYLNGIRNYDGTFKLVLDYARKSDGYGEDSYALPIGNLNPVAAVTSTPKYRPKIAEIQYPYMSEGQLAQTSAWTTASNRNIATVNAARAAASEGLTSLVIPNWASNAVIGGLNFLNPSESLREIVLLSGSTVPSTIATFWQSRELTSVSQLSGSTMPCSPLPNVSVYVPDSLYTQFQADAQWSQLSSRGYDLKPVSTWPRLNPGA